MNWIEYYLPKVNNEESENAFYTKYAKFITIITNVINKQQPTNVIEMGCGTGIITKLILKNSPAHILENKNFILSDISDNMLQLSRLNMTRLENALGDFGRRRWSELQYINHDILSETPIVYNSYNYSYKPEDLVITHGVLEHFSKNEILKIISKLNTDSRIGGHIHYVPTDEYTTKSFGDENLWSVSEWLDLTSPQLAVKDGPDLFLYIQNKHKE